MSNVRNAVVLAAAVFLVSFSLVNAQATSASPSCNDVMLTMGACVNYLTEAKVGTPGDDCCTGLQKTLDTMPDCLCQFLGSSWDQSLGIKVNRTRSLALPRTCGIEGADPSSCKEAGAPTAIPDVVPLEIASLIEIPVPAPKASPVSKDSNGGQSVGYSSLIFFAGVAFAAMAVF